MYKGKEIVLHINMGRIKKFCLISALIKISDDPNELKVANNATENMYIVNPFKGKKSSSSLWSTHPSIEDRVTALRNLK